MSLKYFPQLRQDWIDECLSIYGYIRRNHLQLKFGISPQQATKDLGILTERNAGVYYCPKKRAYLVQGF